MEAGHNGVVGGLLGANHAGRELELVLGLVPILHRQITDEVVLDLVNGHGILIEFAAQVKIILLIKIKQDMDEGILERGFCKTVAINLEAQKNVRLIYRKQEKHRIAN